jgi:dTDP-4-dehydrorhamnose 3,5-epimerase-like enzyme
MTTPTSINEEIIRPVTFLPKGDAKGWLIALQGGEQVPFSIQRIYYIYATESGVRRGKHAHRRLRQMAICVAGSCRFIMDNGFKRQTITLDRNTQGLLIEPMIWHEMEDFSANCVLLVLASDRYDESEYIRNYEEFVTLARGL